MWYVAVWYKQISAFAEAKWSHSKNFRFYFFFFHLISFFVKKKGKKEKKNKKTNRPASVNPTFSRSCKTKDLFKLISCHKNYESKATCNVYSRGLSSSSSSSSITCGSKGSGNGGGNGGGNSSKLSGNSWRCIWLRGM